MKKSYLIVIAALLAGCVTAQVEKNYTVTANATLKDGSSVKGEFCTEQISGSTAFMEKLSIDPTIVKSLTFAGTNGETKVELTNGDKFAMAVANENFTIKSLLGELNIPRNNFRALSLYARKAFANGNDAGLVFYCTFDDEASLTSPAVGPSVKLELGQIKDNGKNGGALFVQPGVAGAEVTLPEGTLATEGCIEFWANMASGKTEFSTGGDPRFFVMFDANGSEIAHFEFASNNGCGNSGLGGHLYGFRTQTNTGYSYMMPYSDIFKGKDYNGWHHYAFVWTQDSLSVFLDGKEVCHANGLINSESITKSTIILDIPLNRRTGKSFNNKSAFFMDELKIWSFAKREFTVTL